MLIQNRYFHLTQFYDSRVTESWNHLGCKKPCPSLNQVNHSRNSHSQPREIHSEDAAHPISALQKVLFSRKNEVIYFCQPHCLPRGWQPVCSGVQGEESTMAHQHRLTQLTSAAGVGLVCASGHQRVHSGVKTRAQRHWDSVWLWDNTEAAETRMQLFTMCFGSFKLMIFLMIQFCNRSTYRTAQSLWVLHCNSDRQLLHAEITAAK